MPRGAQFVIGAMFPLLLLVSTMLETSMASPSKFRLRHGPAAMEGQFPSTVLLRSETGGYLCTGTLIGKMTIVTAGHCLCNPAGNLTTVHTKAVSAFRPLPPSNTFPIEDTVVAGSYEDRCYASVNETEAESDAKPARIVPGPAGDDIGLVLLKEPLTPSQDWSTSPLPSPNGIYHVVGGHLRMVNYGLNDRGEIGILRTDIAQVVQCPEGKIKNVERALCVTHHTSANMKPIMNGNNGGALLDRNGVILGVASDVIIQATGKAIGVYASIAKNLEDLDITPDTPL